MKKLLFVAISVSVAVGAAFAVNPGNDPNLSKAEKEKLLMQIVGGFIDIPGKGSIVIVNAQQSFDLNLISNTTTLASNNLKTPFLFRQGKFDVTTARKTVDSFGATAGLFVIDDPSYPMSLSSTEARWGLVNIAPLRDGADGEKLVKRVAKEFNRVLMFVFGGGLSSMKTSIMRPIVQPSDLDKCVNVWTPFDTMSSVVNGMAGFGIIRAKRTTYRKACQEGWAPEPTNDVQKVIWEQVRAKPTKPMKIKYDPKKGE